MGEPKSMEKYWRVYRLMRFLFGALTHMEVVGAERLPREGACVLTVNHISRLDTPVLMLAASRPICPLVANKYQNHWMFRWLLQAGDAIWINREEFDRDSLIKAMDVLRRGEVLGIAPEGTRSRTASLQPGKAGAAFLAARSGAPVVPVAITGTHTMSRDFMRLRRMRIRVAFGEPFHLPKEGKLSTAELRSSTEMIMARIAALLPPEYRGVYAQAVVSE